MNKYQKADLIIGLACAFIIIVGAITIHWGIASFLMPTVVIVIIGVTENIKKKLKEKR